MDLRQKVFAKSASLYGHISGRYGRFKPNMRQTPKFKQDLAIAAGLRAVKYQRDRAADLAAHLYTTICKQKYDQRAG